MKLAKAYTEKETAKKLKDIWLSNKKLPSAVLLELLDPESYTQAKRLAEQAEYRKEKQALFHSYSKAPAPEELLHLLNSEDTKTLITTITGKKTGEIKAEAYSFGWKDYTLLHDKNRQKPSTDIILDLTEEWDEDARGHIVYTDGTGDYFRIPIRPNMLIIAERKGNSQRYVEYINHKAGQNKRHLIIGTHQKA